MAEKVIHGVSGLHFEARNSLDLSEVLVKAATDKELWGAVYSEIPRPPTYEESACQYLHVLSQYQRNSGEKREIRQ